MYKNLAGRAVLAWAAACFLSPAFSQPQPQQQAPKAPLKIGFVYVTPVTDAGWVRQHEEGRRAAGPSRRRSATRSGPLMSRTWPKAPMPSA